MLTDIEIKGMNPETIAQLIDIDYFEQNPRVIFYERPYILGEMGRAGALTYDALLYFERYTVIVVKLPSGKFHRAFLRPERRYDDIATATMFALEAAEFEHTELNNLNQ